jgi:hypothetical protein
MSNYLKDSFIPYHTIDLPELDGINDDLKEIVEKANSSTGDGNPLQLAMFFGSLILASICSPSLKLKDSFLVVYIGSLLVFSNLWTYVLISIKKLRDDFWPIVSFKRKPLGLFGQTVLAFAITGILAWLVDLGWKILLDASSLVVK